MSARHGSSCEGTGSNRFVPAERWLAGRQRDAATDGGVGTGTSSRGTALQARSSLSSDPHGESYDVATTSARSSGQLDEPSSPSIDVSFDSSRDTISPPRPAFNAAAGSTTSNRLAASRATPAAGRGRPAKRARLKASGKSIAIPPGAMPSPRPAQGTSFVPRMTAPQGAWPANPPPPISASTFTTSSAVPPPHTGWQPSFPPTAAAECRSKASDVDRLLSWHWAEFKRQESPEQSLRTRPSLFFPAPATRPLFRPPAPPVKAKAGEESTFQAVSPPASTSQQPSSSILALFSPSLSAPGDTAAAASTFSSMPHDSGTSRSSFSLQSPASSPAYLHDSNLANFPSSQRSTLDPTSSPNESRVESGTADGAGALDSLAELARRPSPFLQKSVSTAASTSAQAWEVDKGVNGREETSKCDAGDQEGNEQAKKTEDEEVFGEEAALEAADRLRKRLLDIARSVLPAITAPSHTRVVDASPTPQVALFRSTQLVHSARPCCSAFSCIAKYGRHHCARPLPTFSFARTPPTVCASTRRHHPGQTNERAGSSQGGLGGSEPCLTPKRERSPSASSTRATPQDDGEPARKRAKLARWTQEEELAFLEIRKSAGNPSWDTVAEKLAEKGFPKRSGAALRARWTARDGSNHSPGLGSEVVRLSWSAQEKVDLLAISTRGGECWTSNLPKTNTRWEMWTPYFPGKSRTDLSVKAHDLRQAEEKRFAKMGMKPIASKEVQLRWQFFKAPTRALSLNPELVTSSPTNLNIQSGSALVPPQASTSATPPAAVRAGTNFATYSDAAKTHSPTPNPPACGTSSRASPTPPTLPNDSAPFRLASPSNPASSSAPSLPIAQSSASVPAREPYANPLAALTAGGAQPILDQLVSGLCAHLSRKLESGEVVVAGDARTGASVTVAGGAEGSDTGARKTSDEARGQPAAGWGDEEDPSWLPRTKRGVALEQRLRGIAARLAA